MMDNRTTNNVGQFYWWFGVVEDRDDPLRMGRCRVRIMGYHIDNKEALPTEDLPWAFPIMPANNPSISGTGTSSNGVVTGTWVVGFFADGSDGQHPMFFGTVGAVPGGPYGDPCAPAGGNGASDPGASSGGETDDPSRSFSSPPALPVRSGTPGKAGRIYDMIAQYESVRGSYGSVLGGSVNNQLTHMTIGEAAAYGDNVRRNTAIGRRLNSSAIGRYQFVASTLRDLVNRKRAARFSDKFDERMQDHLCDVLCDGLITKFLNGTATAEQLTAKIGRIWQSVPYNAQNQTIPNGAVSKHWRWTQFVQALNRIKNS